MRFLGVHLFALFLLFLSSGCLKDGEVLVDDLANIKAQVFKVKNQNGKLVIEGKNLNATQKVRIKGNSIDNEMVIQSKNKTRIVAALSQALTFTASAVYELVLSNAYGQSVYQLSFEIQDGQVTTVKLADGAVTGDKISDMGALSGQILKYNGTTWSPADLNSLVYAGTWDASTGTEPNSSPVGGDFWIVDTDGDVDLGDGNGVRQWRIGDWIVYNSFTGQWDQVISSQSVVSFNGRAGEVTPEADDYTWQQIDKTLAPIDDLTDVDTSTVAPGVGEVLKWDGSNWTPQIDENDGGDITSVNAGTGLLGGATSGDADLDIDVGTSANQIPQLDGSGLLLNSIIPGLDSSKITSGTMNTARLPYASSTTDGIISSSDYQTFSATDTTLSNGAAGEYLDGDGNWYLLDNTAAGLGNVTNDQQIPLANLNTSTALGTDDTLVPSQNAVKTYVDNSVSTASNDYLLRDGTQAMTGNFDGGANELTNISNATLSSELRLSDLDDSNYVGLKSPDNVSTNYVWMLPAAEGGAGQVLSTDGSGNLSWVSSGDGSVTDVTATLPLSSSGTNTPDISISQSSSTTDGYLSSTDWNTFDAKEDALGTGTANQYLDENKTWQNLDTDAVTEGSNLYYTTARARTDAVDDAIADAVTDVAPSQNAVFDALALKADQSSLSNYVLKGGDTMTGALNLPADGLAVGTNQLITSGGNVGVGTSSPAYQLHLKNTGQSTLAVDGSSTGDSELRFLEDGVMVWNVERKSGSNNLNFLEGTNARLSLNTGGNIGVGTTTPIQKLDVSAGHIKLDSNYAIGYEHGNATAEHVIYPMRTNSQTALAGLGPSAPHDTAMSFETDAQINFVETDADSMVGYMDVNTSRFIWGGDIGVGGVTAPQAALDINGGIKVSGGDILRNINPATGVAGDAFRIRYNSNLFGTNLDGLMIEKTDGNNLTPDGGIAFVNTGSDGVERFGMVVRGNGRVGIGGVASPSYPLQVNGDAGKSTGTSWINTSDIRLKDILGPFDKGLEEILALDVVNYRYKQNNPLGLQSEKPIVGFIAQDVQKVIPEAISQDDHGYLQLDADPILWSMVNAIKEQQKRIRKLENENEMMKSYLCEKDPEAPFCS